MANFFDNVTEEQLKMYEGVLNGTYTLADVYNLQKDELEGFYNVAYNQYNAGNFKGAEKVFKFLALFETWEAKYSLGYAACVQARGDFEKAIEIYSASMIAGGLEDPTPLYQSAICFLKLEKVEEAISSLQMAIITGDPAKYIEIREQSRNLLAVIEETMQQN